MAKTQTQSTQTQSAERETAERRKPHSRPVSDLSLADGAPARPVMGRRSFLRQAVFGIGAAFVLADAAVAYRAYDQGVMAEGHGPAFDAWKVWRNRTGPEALVGAAILAANAHNSQPWLFDLFPDRVDLRADLTRSTGANDALNRELFVSLGCALENMLIAAPANGFRPELLPIASSQPDDLVASVALSSQPQFEPDLYQTIGNRHSNRSAYRSDPIPPSSIEAMRSLADESVAPARLVWLVDDRARTRFGQLLVEATVAHIADDDQSKASFAWWRGDWNAIQRHKDGLNIDGVGLPPLVRTLGKILPTTSRESADQTFLDRTRIQVRTAAAFGIVVVDDPTSRSQQLAGGRLLQRLHLWAAAHDLGFQHMNQVTERIDRDQQLGRVSPFSSPLEELAEPTALAAFRVGTPTVRSAPSPRRAPSEVTR